MSVVGWSYLGTLLAVLFVLLYKYSTRKYDYWKKRNIPEIKPIPFLGSIFPLLVLRKTIGEWLWDHYKNIQGDYIGMFIFDQPVLVIKSAKLVKSIIQKDFDYFQDRTLVTNMDDPIMNNLLFIKKNPMWKPIRSKLSPMFTSGKLKSMFPLILQESEAMTEYLSKYANVPNIEAKEVSAKYSTNVIARCAFAVDAGSFTNEDAEFRSLSREMFGFRIDTAFRQMGSWFMPNLIMLFRVQFFNSRIVNSLKRIFIEVLQLRKQTSNLKGNDLIDMLLETNRKGDNKVFTDDAMVGHAIQFFAAGFETVSSTLSFALYEMAINQEMQDRLRAEMQETFGKDNNITYSAVHDMKYLDMIVCETLRKYPVLPFLDRTCKADFKVAGSDMVIEKGIPVYIPMFGLHYDPKYFPDPMTFNPERFADKTWLNNDGMFYLPFGEGPRICLGERFGLLGVKLGLAAILSKFKVVKSDKTPVPIEYEPKSVVLQSKVGVPMTFVPV